MTLPQPNETFQLSRARAPDLLDIQVAVLDPCGKVVSACGNWLDLHPARETALPWMGCDLALAFESAGDQASQRIGVGIRSVLLGEQAQFQAQYSPPAMFRPRKFQIMVATLDGQDSGVIVTRTDISDLKQTRSPVECLTRHDQPIHLPDRHVALAKLEELLRPGATESAGIGVISLCISDFGELNDVYGHSLGNRLFQQFTSQLTRRLPPDALLYRVTGSECLLLLSGVSSTEALQHSCEQILEQSGGAIALGDIELHLQLNAGVTLAPRNGTEPDQLLQQASIARKSAKQAGQPFQCYDACIKENLLLRIQTRQALRLALERQQLELYYQPQIDLRSGTVVGVEALMRWNRPGHGLVAPRHFVATAEESGLMRPMGRWALREACRQAASWRQSGWPGLRVAVNLSAAQFVHEAIRWDVLDALEESGLPPACLELELTESLLLAANDRVLTALAYWKQAGIQLAIDDFGTGYSNLSYLKQMDVDRIKIDRSFVSLADKQDLDIVRAILQMARRLGIRTTAEGIETPRLARQLARMGCDEGQGYLYARPMPAGELTAWLDRYQPQAPRG